jgi:hypothetical protein
MDGVWLLLLSSDPTLERSKIRQSPIHPRLPFNSSPVKRRQVLILHVRSVNNEYPTNQKLLSDLLDFGF